MAKEKALYRHVGPEAAEKERSKTPFSLGDDQVIEKLLVDSGFFDVEVHAEELHLVGTTEIFTSSSSFAELGEETAAAVAQDVREAMGPFTSGQVLLFRLDFTSPLDGGRPVIRLTKWCRTVIHWPFTVAPRLTWTQSTL